MSRIRCVRPSGRSPTAVRRQALQTSTPGIGKIFHDLRELRREQLPPRNDDKVHPAGRVEATEDLANQPFSPIPLNRPTELLRGDDSQPRRRPGALTEQDGQEPAVQPGPGVEDGPELSAPPKTTVFGE